MAVASLSIRSFSLAVNGPGGNARAAAVGEAFDQEAPGILEAAFRRLAEFTGCAEACDDRTLVIVKHRPIVSALPV